MTRTALIIGATGSFGAHAACALIRHGWTVKALARDPAAAARKVGDNTPVEWIAGDGMKAEDVARAAKGVQVIVHAANPPQYRNWRGLALPMMRASIEAAAAEGARIVLPGTVYNYAPDAGRQITEATPQAPVTRKGKVRVEMEEMIREATSRGARGLVLRAGDFFGPAAPNSGLQWLTTRKAGRVTGVYRTGEGHAFAYLPDLAETLARLLDREAELADFDVFNFAGDWMEGPDALGEAVRRATGDVKTPIKAFPWPVVFAAAPFVTMFRELLEMRYLWTRAIGMNDAKLRAFLGEVPSTPLDVAMKEALADLEVEIPAKSWTKKGADTYVAGHVGTLAI
jgi:nucleoside-diphosphate-sugar epimerase